MTDFIINLVAGFVFTNGVIFSVVFTAILCKEEFSK
jgi:hypothetical protein